MLQNFIERRDFMRPKKEPRESFGSTLRKDLMEKLRELSEDTSIPISKLLDQSVELLLESRGVQRSSKKNPNQRSEDKYYVDIDLD